jgi:hypothetical protein
MHKYLYLKKDAWWIYSLPYYITFCRHMIYKHWGEGMYSMQGFGSVFIWSGSGSSVWGWRPIRIRIQSGSRALMTKNWKEISAEKKKNLIRIPNPDPLARLNPDPNSRYKRRLERDLLIAVAVLVSMHSLRHISQSTWACGSYNIGPHSDGLTFGLDKKGKV